MRGIVFVDWAEVAGAGEEVPGTVWWRSRRWLLGLRQSMGVGRSHRYWWGFRDSNSPRRVRFGGNAQDALLARISAAGGRRSPAAELARNPTCCCVSSLILLLGHRRIASDVRRPISKISDEAKGDLGGVRCKQQTETVWSYG